MKLPTYNDLSKEADKDLTIDETDEGFISKSLKIPYLVGKWSKAAFALGEEVDRLDTVKKRVYRERYTYYARDYNVELSQKETEVYVNGDGTYQDAVDAYKKAVRLLEFAESIMKRLTEMSYNINNAIRMREFVNGGRR